MGVLGVPVRDLGVRYRLAHSRTALLGTDFADQECMDILGRNIP